MKKINLIEKLIAATLAIIMAFQFQVPTLAATESKQYVSDVIVSYGEGDAAEADAKDWLTQNGYTVIDTNLNAGAEASTASSSAWSWATSARSARAVYLGYKTTDDASQAITSLKAMNMTGSYSFDSYQEVLDQMADETKAFMEDLAVTLKEWRENYKAGRGKAVEAYYLLQMMYSPDNNNMMMGDLLLNETKEELGDEAYNKLSAEEKLLHADMTTILMQGNADAMKYMEQILAMGADTDAEKTWLDRLSEMGSYDDMMDSLEKEAEEKNETFLPSDAAAQLASEYDNTAQLLAVKITSLQESFKEYVESGTTLQDDESAIDNFIDDNTEDGSFDAAAEWLSVGTLYEALASYKYPSADNPDRTLQDFFMEEFNADDADSRSQLYPMAAALSAGQRSAIEFVTMQELISQGIITDEEAEASIVGIKEYVAHGETISIFNGVDRSVFDSSSTALTSSARELQNSSQKSYTEGLFGTPISLGTTISAAVFTVSCLATVGCAMTVKMLKSATACRNSYDKMLRKISSTIDTREWVEEIMERNNYDADYALVNIVADAKKGDGIAKDFLGKDYEAVANYVDNHSAVDYKASLIKGMKIATGVLVVVTIALGVWTVISGINDLKAYYNRDMDLYPIPENMVDEAAAEDGSMTYTYYKAVQCNRVEKGFTEDREVLKDNADLNGDLGKEWLALYYTKDESAGDPIVVSDIAGFTVVKGQDATPEGAVALSIFGQENPVNLTNSEWVWNDATDGLYLYYTADDDTHTASIFSSANVWVLYVGCGVVVAAIFFLGGLFVGRKRRQAREGKTAQA